MILLSTSYCFNTGPQLAGTGGVVSLLGQEHMMTSSFIAEEEEERVTSYFGHGESRISRVYYK